MIPFQKLENWLYLQICNALNHFISQNFGIAKL